MIFSPSGASVGIGFAIPSDLAANVMRQLVAYGEVRRGALGVDTQDITPEIAGMLGIDAGKGAVVTRVRSGTAAATAGLKPGDVITAVNGKAIGSGQELHNIEGLTPIGTSLKLDLLREGKLLSVAMTLNASASTSLRGGDLDARLAGVRAQRSRAIRNGGRVSAAAWPRASNDRAGPMPAACARGDVIVGINQRDIDDTGDLADLLQRTPRQLLLTVVRGQSVFYLLLK